MSISFLQREWGTIAIVFLSFAYLADYKMVKKIVQLLQSYKQSYKLTEIQLITENDKLVNLLSTHDETKVNDVSSP